jgi:hypothetical protein
LTLPDVRLRFGRRAMFGSAPLQPPQLKCALSSQLFGVKRIRFFDKHCNLASTLYQE